MIRGITLLNTTGSIGLFLSLTLGIFLFLRRRANPANAYLGGVLLIFGLMILPGWLWGGHWLKYIPQLGTTQWLTTFALGPLIYFYVRASTERNFALSRRDGWHFLPTVLSWGYVLPIAFGNPTHILNSWDHVMLHGSHTALPSWESLLRLLHMLVYVALSIRIGLRYRRHIQSTSSSIQQQYHRWLLAVGSFLAFPILALILFAVSGYAVISLRAFTLLIVIFCMAVYVATLFQPSLFRRFPNQMASSQETAVEREKYQSSSLTEPKKDQLVEQLLAHMEREKPYLEPQLTLSDLAEQLDLPAHYLSQLVNERLNVSFLDFVNGYRVATARELLSDAQYDHYSLVGVGFEAGFNSKTAFYSAFKRVTSSTPGSFRKSLKKISHS